MGLYLLCIDGGGCITVYADSCEEAGMKAKERFPEARSITVIIDQVNNRSPIATTGATNFAKN